MLAIEHGVGVFGSIRRVPGHFEVDMDLFKRARRAPAVVRQPVGLDTYNYGVIIVFVAGHTEFAFELALGGRGERATHTGTDALAGHFGGIHFMKMRSCFARCLTTGVSKVTLSESATEFQLALSVGEQKEKGEKEEGAWLHY